VKKSVRFFIYISIFYFGQTVLFAQAVSFTFNGSNQTYTVPPCVTSLTFTVAGADGGGPSGGNGAVVTATVAVTPGQVITLIVGGSGNGIAGGFGGGGGGRTANNTPNASFGGGGASRVLIGGVPVIIAAGGGGQGGGGSDAAGGSGGCATGLAGVNAFGGGGLGGNQFNGGGGGTPWSTSANTGSAGSLSQGGIGAIDPCFNTAPGGGGGGGYYGGGGGGSDCFSFGAVGGGGGGGGSSLIPAGAGCNPGTNNGPGYITISGFIAPIVPIFAAIPAICSGAAFPTLPATSLNAQSGTWSPAANNLATTTYTFTPSGPCPGATATLTVVVNPNATPAFTQVAPICSGATLNPLPTISTNGINGTWGPALNNLAATTYTFTPNAGLCAVSTTMTIVVNPNIIPTFNSVTPICAGEILAPLPIISTNGITGTWLPALNNQATATYTFLFTAGQCATTNNLTITVNPVVTPTFNAVADICEGGILSPLPLTSINGITGTWSPSLNNLATTVYTFTPTAGLCASATTLTTVVNPNILPTFTQVAPICSGEILAPLPTTSQNGLNGTWSPALDNTATTVYTFSPTSGVCSLSETMTITVNPNITPTFTAVAPICSGATLSALPTTANNGVIGSWSPAPNNLTTTNYTFVPTAFAGSCDLPTTMSITVTPNVTPTFSQVVSICSGGTLSALPISSANGVAGAWSPALNNTATTIYTFTPTVGLCALPTTMTITVDSNIAPTFSQVAPICSGSVLSPLPASSVNGIAGSWTPAVNNTSTTTYTFTPTAGLCALTATMSITVEPNITPTFPAIPAICAGTPILPFPTSSLNGLNGSWSPAPNNSATTTYTFTPIAVAGACVQPITLSVIVNPNSTPNFTQIAPICFGENLNSFPTSSPNGINGTWLPTPNSLATTAYNFTPSAGQCALASTMTVNVNPLPEPSFTFVKEVGCAPILVTFTNTSQGGTIYNWSFGNGSSSVIPNPTITYSADGCYDVSLTASTNLGCSSTVFYNDSICITPAPEASFSSSLGALSEDALTNSFFNESQNGTWFSWDFGDGSDPVEAFEGSHTYPSALLPQYTVTLTAMNDLGCMDTYSLTYELEEQLVYFIPNTFTPDGDQFNHVFKPIFTSGYNPTSYNLKIFNRWGENLFESNDPSVGWSGHYSNGEAHSGTYNWVIEFDGKSSYDTNRITGIVNLLR